MNRIARRLILSAGAILAILSARPSNAQLLLTNIVITGTDSSGAYQTQHDWHTANLPSNAFVLFVIDGPNLGGTYLNGPAQTNAGISIPLTSGDYTFTLVNSANLPDRDFFGINLGFNGTSGPSALAMSAFGAAWSGTGATPSFAATAPGTPTRWYDNQIGVPQNNALTRVIDGYSVTLLDFGYTKRIPGFNIVGPYQNTPGGVNDQLDQRGIFRLRVAPVVVPEASGWLLLCCGLPLVALRRRYAGSVRTAPR